MNLFQEINWKLIYKGIDILYIDIQNSTLQYISEKIQRGFTEGDVIEEYEEYENDEDEDTEDNRLTKKSRKICWKITFTKRIKKKIQKENLQFIAEKIQMGFTDSSFQEKITKKEIQKYLENTEG